MHTATQSSERPTWEHVKALEAAYLALVDQTTDLFTIVSEPLRSQKIAAHKAYLRALGEHTGLDLVCLVYWDETPTPRLPATTPTPPTSPVKDVMPTASTRRNTGIVTYFNAKDKYGYIKTPSGDSVRFTSMRLAHAAMSIKKGDKVTFFMQFQGVNEGTPQAIDVRVDGWVAPARARYEPTAEENASLAALKAKEKAARDQRRADRERRAAGNAEFAARLRNAAGE